MSRFETAVAQKITTLEELIQKRALWKLTSRKVVFTNGVFDILHPGHYRYLMQARDLGHALIVGLNSDASTKRLKGPERPINPEQSRALALASLLFVDAVLIFDEVTPARIITALVPDVLVKGGDYTPDQSVGADVVKLAGGEVKSLPFVSGHSTTSFIDKLRHGKG